MSELERLRQAMRDTERPATSLDLAAVMREGRRLRIRRRVAGAGAATLAAGLAAAVVVVAVGTSPGGPPTPERPPPVAVAPPPAGASPSASAWLEPTPPPTVARDVPPPKPLGQVIDSEVRHGADQRVYYFVGVSVPGEPKVSVGLAAGRRAPDGMLTTDILVNDVDGADRSPGFHQIGYDERSSTVPVPTFGYFVGPAQRIVGTAGARQIDARLARWSEDKQVLIFWFDPAELAPGQRLDGITARDANGRRL